MYRGDGKGSTGLGSAGNSCTSLRKGLPASHRPACARPTRRAIKVVEEAIGREGASPACALPLPQQQGRLERAGEHTCPIDVHLLFHASFTHAGRFYGCVDGPNGRLKIS